MSEQQDNQEKQGQEIQEQETSEQDKQEQGKPEQSSTFALETVIAQAVKVPGVKVNRKAFLAEQFKDEKGVSVTEIVEKGPIEAGVSRKDLERIAGRVILQRTSVSSAASFALGLPGGVAMAAAIPGDILQFFAVSLRLAQELSYLYGYGDLWDGSVLDEEKVRNQLVLYCGVMFGAAGAEQGLRVLSAQLAKAVAKNLQAKALMKTFWYPIIKKIGQAIGIKVTKSTLAHGVSKVIPVVGGVVSGAINFASMMPMATKLQKTFDKAVFDYTEEEMQEDIIEMEEISTEEEEKEKAPNKFDPSKIGEAMGDGVKKVGDGIAGLFSGIGKKSENADGKAAEESSEKQLDEADKLELIKRYKELLDIGAITQEEYDAKKKELLGL